MISKREAVDRVPVNRKLMAIPVYCTPFVVINGTENFCRNSDVLRVIHKSSTPSNNISIYMEDGNCRELWHYVQDSKIFVVYYKKSDFSRPNATQTPPDSLMDLNGSDGLRTV
jgi:hypothetical protein